MSDWRKIQQSYTEPIEEGTVEGQLSPDGTFIWNNDGLSWDYNI